MSPDLQLLAVLRQHGVAFVIVGGHAVNFHGYRRATEDIDIVWMRSAEQEQALFRALTEVEAHYIGSEIDPETGIERTYSVTLPWIQSTRLMMLYTKHGFLDLFDYIPGCPDADPQELITTSIEAADLRFVSVEWLRRMKHAAGRPRDLLDLENLPK